MSWALLDDRLHSHPKVRRLQRDPSTGAEAFGIWSWCLSWCRAYSPTEGRVELEDVADAWRMDIERMRSVFTLLVDVGLVDPIYAVPTGPVIGYLIHDWDDYQSRGVERQRLAGIARAASARRVGGRFASSESIDRGPARACSTTPVLPSTNQEGSSTWSGQAGTSLPAKLDKPTLRGVVEARLSESKASHPSSPRRHREPSH